MKRRTAGVLAAAGAAVLALALASVFAGREPIPTAPLAVPQPAGPPPAEARWIVAGGGPLPESNEISIEDDLLLATKVLGGEGLVLYAGGGETRAVRVEANDLAADPLVAELGAFFAPRTGRSSRYQATRLGSSAAATPAALVEALRAATAASGPPLTVYLAGHGDAGETAAQNTLAMWANTTLTPVELAEALEGARRRTRVVVTSCFSGGFAEIAFKEADERLGAAAADVCGLFASTWDREAGGCDPDPDRGLHDGYGVHFLSALDGKRRDGTKLEPAAVDVDRDGVVSLLDAHTYALRSSTSIDVPTTTSERWLRAAKPDDVAPATLALPHEDAVIEELGSRLGVAHEVVARAKLSDIDARLAALTDGETKAAAAETEAYWDAAGALLGRWPVLDDPWHALWAQTVAADREAIAAFLRESEELRAWRTATAAVDALAQRRADLEVERAPLHRLVRAHETLRLAASLKQRGGDDWARFEALRACENSAP